MTVHYALRRIAVLEEEIRVLKIQVKMGAFDSVRVDLLDDTVLNLVRQNAELRRRVDEQEGNIAHLEELMEDLK